MGKKTFRNAIVVASLLLAVGCSNANWHSIHQGFDVQSGKAELIDMYQRAIIAKDRPGGELVVCAEPVPDALSVVASQLAGNVNVYSKVDVALSAADQQSASFVGLRTQSIQLLRDQGYNLCQAYMNGAIDKAEYNIFLRRNQKDMAAILAIEQLTMIAKSTATTISAAAPPVSIQSSYSTAKGATKTTINTAMANPAGAAAFSNPTSAKKNGGSPASGNYDPIANVIGGIVNGILKTDDIGQTCWAFFMSHPSDNVSKYYNICGKYYDQWLDAQKGENELLQNRNKLIEFLMKKYVDGKTTENEQNQLTKLLMGDPSQLSSAQSVLPAQGVQFHGKISLPGL